MDLKKVTKTFTPVFIEFVQGMKKEIEADGLIATADEILERLEALKNSNE